MVLVDTSVWIRFLANWMPYAVELDRLLEDSGGQSKLLNSYDLIHRVPAIGHADVVISVRSHKLHGRGIGSIDPQLLSALVADAFLSHQG